jgi:hypothetical protein
MTYLVLAAGEEDTVTVNPTAREIICSFCYLCLLPTGSFLSFLFLVVLPSAQPRSYEDWCEMSEIGPNICNYLQNCLKTKADDQLQSLSWWSNSCDECLSDEASNHIMKDLCSTVDEKYQQSLLAVVVLVFFALWTIGSVALAANACLKHHLNDQRNGTDTNPSDTEAKNNLFQLKKTPPAPAQEDQDNSNYLSPGNNEL